MEQERSLGEVTLTARTVTAGRAWHVAMLIQVRIDTPKVTVLKNCESVEELRAWLKTHMR